MDTLFILCIFINFTFFLYSLIMLIGSRNMKKEMWIKHIEWRQKMEAKFDKNVLGKDFYLTTEELIKNCINKKVI